MRLINADELKVKLSEDIIRTFQRWGKKITVAEMETWVRDEIDNTPIVEQKYYERVIAQINPVIEARPQGEWIIHNKGEHNEWHECPYCNNHKKYYARFCDYCGADMRKEKTDGKS